LVGSNVPLNNNNNNNNNNNKRARYKMSSSTVQPIKTYNKTIRSKTIDRIKMS